LFIPRPAALLWTLLQTLIYSPGRVSFLRGEALLSALFTAPLRPALAHRKLPGNGARRPLCSCTGAVVVLSDRLLFVLFQSWNNTNRSRSVSARLGPVASLCLPSLAPRPSDVVVVWSCVRPTRPRCASREETTQSPYLTTLEMLPQVFWEAWGRQLVSFTS